MSSLIPVADVILKKMLQLLNRPQLPQHRIHNLILLILCSVQARILQATHGVRISFSEARQHCMERQACQSGMPEYLLFNDIQSCILLHEKSHLVLIET